LILPAATLGDCFRRDVGLFDFELIRDMLTSTMLLKHYDPVKHAFHVHAEPLQKSVKRIESLYSHAVR
jgi:hypothetical protein